jgi:hypothetical protein
VKIGIAVESLGPSQISFLLISKANSIVHSRPDIDIVVFYESISRPCITPHFAMMQLAEGWGYDGHVVATAINTAEKLLQFPSAKTRSWYCWDLDWTRQRRMFSSFRSVYGDPSLNLIARGESHQKAIRSAWHRDVSLVKDFDFTELMSCLSSFSTTKPVGCFSSTNTTTKTNRLGLSPKNVSSR